MDRILGQTYFHLIISQFCPSLLNKFFSFPFKNFHKHLKLRIWRSCSQFIFLQQENMRRIHCFYCWVAVVLNLHIVHVSIFHFPLWNDTFCSHLSWSYSFLLQCKRCSNSGNFEWDFEAIRDRIFCRINCHRQFC